MMEHLQNCVLKVIRCPTCQLEFPAYKKKRHNCFEDLKKAVVENKTRILELKEKNGVN